MNKPELEKLAQIVERMQEDNFDMDVWVYTLKHSYNVYPEDFGNCGTTCCMAGAYHLSKGRSIDQKFAYVIDQDGHILGYVEDVAREELGLTALQATRLFHFPDWPYKYIGHKPTPTIAANRIRYMIATGK